MNAHHPKVRYWVRRRIFDGLQCFADFEARIDEIPKEKDRGDIFEIFVEAYLATQPIMQSSEAWVVGTVPLSVRDEYNLPGDARGIDGVYKSRLGDFVPYQVKFRSGRPLLKWSEVTPFLSVTSEARDRVIFTNTNRVAVDAHNRPGVRLVRGIDFDALAQCDFAAIEAWLNERPATAPRLLPLPYQQIALDDIEKAFVTHDRATVVMACGTGKTLISLWATERAKPKTALVLVPSLILLKQTLETWSKQNAWGSAYSYLCVCSDQTIGRGVDELEIDESEIEFRIDTEPSEVRRFLTQDSDCVKVIFATYHSSSVVGDGCRGLPPFDVGIFDEAHKTVGHAGGAFSFALSNKNIEVRWRIFFTATPRHIDIRHRDKDGEFAVHSMDDESVYGIRAHTLSFASAAKQNIICGYKVIITLIDQTQVSAFALTNGITLVDKDLLAAKWVANLIAIQKAVTKRALSKVVSFHSRVATARDFATNSPRGLGRYLPNFDVQHVHGKQSAVDRGEIIERFQRAPKGVLTNARCLTEGIDVPAVDMVAFLDPKHSKVDIAQATGRAMRKLDGSGKTTGYVLVPLFAHGADSASIDEAVKGAEFGDVAEVLNALQEQDEDLVDIIRELQEDKGQGKAFDPRRLREKVEVLGPTVELSRLTESIFLEISNRLGVTWDERLGQLRAYRQTHGDCNVSGKREDNYELGRWCGRQRTAYDNKALSQNRIERLSELSFVWDRHAAAWAERIAELRTYRDTYSNSNVPQDWKDNRALGLWCGTQRTKRKNDELPADRIAQLNELDFVWDPFSTAWEEMVLQLCAYKEKHGDCNVPQGWKINRKLGSWCRRQRKQYENNELSPDQIAQLNALGFLWSVFYARWEEGFAQLCAYEQEHDDCNVPAIYLANRKLGNWCSQQRTMYKSNRLLPDRIKRLEEIGFQFSIFESKAK